MTLSRVSFTVALVSVFCVAGCSRSEPSVSEVNNTNLKKLRGAYGMYLIAHEMQGPKSEEAFKEYLKNDPGAIVKLGRMDVASPDGVDAMFISERDGQPFKVRYGLEGIGDHAIVFESEGVDGKRMVAFVDPREVDDAEYEALWTAKADATTGMEQMNQAAGLE